MNGMNTYVVRGLAFVRLVCFVCRGHGFTVTPSSIAPCHICRGEGMIEQK